MINTTALELKAIAKLYKPNTKPTHTDEEINEMLLKSAENGCVSSKWWGEKLVLSYEQMKELAAKGFTVSEITVESPIAHGRKMFVGHEITWGE